MASLQSRQFQPRKTNGDNSDPKAELWFRYAIQKLIEVNIWNE